MRFLASFRLFPDFAATISFAARPDQPTARFQAPSFRGAHLRANPESSSLALDSGFARKGSRPGMTTAAALSPPYSAC
jgi:hypothetical protein